MASVRKLTLQILGNATGAIGALKGTGDAAGSMGKRLAGAMPSFKALALSGTAAFGALSAGAYKAVQAAAEDEKSFKLLEKQLKATVGASDAQVSAVERQITAMMRATGIADDELRPAFASLVRGTNSVADSTKLMQVALDVSAGTGKGVAEVASALSKAYNGNMGALTRLGLPLDENIKKSKDAQAAIGQLATTFAGQADVAADTFSGRLTIMKTGLGEVTESVGYALLPAMTSAVGFITDAVLPALGGFSDALSEGGLAGGLTFLGDAIKNSAPAVLSALGEFFAEAVTWIRDTGIPLWVSAVSAIGGYLIGWIQPRIPMIIDKLKAFFKSMLDWILNTGLPFLVEKAQKLGDALVGWIGKAAREVPHKLVTFLGEIGAWLLSTAVPKLLELGLKLLGSLIKWTATLGKDLIIGLGGAVVALVAALPDLFMGLLKGLAKIGVSAVKFFMDKFKALAVAIGDLAIGAVNFLIEQFNKIPLVPNIPLITLDLKKATGQMGLTAEQTDAVSAGMNHFSDSAYTAKNQTAGLIESTKDLNLELGGGGAGGGGGAKKTIETATEQLKKYTDAMKASSAASKAKTEATKGVTKAQDELTKATDKVRLAQEHFDLIVRGYGKGSKEANKAESERAKAQRDLEKAGYSVEQSIFAVKDAEIKLAETRADPESTPQAIREAEISLAEAKLGVADATDSQTDATDSLAEATLLLDEVTNGAKETSDTYKTALDDLTDAKKQQVDASDRVTEAIDREREAVEKLIEAEKELAVVRGKTPASVIATAEGTGAVSGATGNGGLYGSFMEAVRALHPNSSTLDSATPVLNSRKKFPALYAEYKKAGLALAQGGLVTRPVQALLGENGPEAVIPLSDLRRMGGGEINITVNAGMGADGTEIGQQIIDAIKKAERRSGQVFASA